MISSLMRRAARHTAAYAMRTPQRPLSTTAHDAVLDAGRLVEQQGDALRPTRSWWHSGPIYNTFEVQNKHLYVYEDGEAYLDLGDEGLLGAGAAKVATTAIRIKDNKPCALLTASAWNASDIQSEMKVYAEVAGSEGIPEVWNWGSEADIPIAPSATMVRPLHPGHLQTPRSSLRQDGPFLDVAIGALKGLEALHAKGFNHRDIKPDNLLINDEGHGLVTDLGHATSDNLRRPGALELMHPEMGAYYIENLSRHCVPDIETGFKFDVYAMGLSLEMIRNQRGDVAMTPWVELSRDIATSAFSAEPLMADVLIDNLLEDYDAEQRTPARDAIEQVLREMRNPRSEGIAPATEYRTRLEAIRDGLAKR